MMTPESLAANEPTHWGKWLWHRAAVAGFGTQRQLAKEVGCCNDQMCKWIAMPTAPNSMRKGFDAALCRLLKLDEAMLFNGYLTTAPTAIPLAPAAAPAVVPLASTEQLRREIVSMVGVINGEDELRRVLDVVKTTFLGPGAS